MLLFGYGSLIWKCDFPHTKRLVGHIKGYHRRFWQRSEDHRGTPEYPGRVVTLIPGSEDDVSIKHYKSTPFTQVVYGAAYFISAEEEVKVKQDLDHREKDGYAIRQTMFYPNDGETAPFNLEIYIGVEDSAKNPFYAGESPLEVLAERIVHAHGPSGPNRDYLFHLVAAMKTIAPQHPDEHLESLHLLVKSILDSDDHGRV